MLPEADPTKRLTAAKRLWKHLRSFAGVSIRVQEVQLAMADFANKMSLGKSNNVPTLISAILEDDRSFQACESAAARLPVNEILYYEAAKRICMKDRYATPFRRM